jgi:hypothetical protein
MFSKLPRGPFAGLVVLLVWSFLLCAAEPIAAQSELSEGAAARAYSVRVLTRLAEPVLTALSENKLKKRMPTHEWETSRRGFAPL